jgi:putative pyruvate formate lyase activating enzyme
LKGFSGNRRERIPASPMNEPSYVRLFRTGALAARVRDALALLEDCCLCPRECHVDRTRGETGFCRTGRHARVASVSPHFGEESPLVGTSGSGTIFFSSCSLHCSFCQNHDISHLNQGADVGPAELARMMIRLMEAGCANINFVTPSHVVPQILEAILPAAEAGLKLPLVYNTGGYDQVETLKLLDGIFDIYMPDFKFWEEEHARRYCSAPDYPLKARAALKEMHSQVGDLTMDGQGLALKGLLVRHLVMPGGIAGTEKIMAFIAREISKNTYVNVMDQYYPCFEAHLDDVICRRITREEYACALREAGHAGITRLDGRHGPFLMTPVN